MHKCTLGDLSVIVYAYNTVNIGSIVRVLAVHPNQIEIQSRTDDVLWTCQSAHPMTYASGNEMKQAKIGPVPDSYMKPIRGESLGMDIALGVVIEQIRQEQHDDVAASVECYL